MEVRIKRRKQMEHKIVRVKKEEGERKKEKVMRKGSWKRKGKNEQEVR